MLNGRYDSYFPLETSQRPVFRLLATPPRDKRMVVSEAGHFVPRTQLIKETLDWFGPVPGAGSPTASFTTLRRSGSHHGVPLGEGETLSSPIGPNARSASRLG